METGGRQSIYIVRSEDLHRGVGSIVFLETGGRQSVLRIILIVALETEGVMYGIGVASARR